VRNKRFIIKDLRTLGYFSYNKAHNVAERINILKFSYAVPQANRANDSNTAVKPFLAGSKSLTTGNIYYNSARLHYLCL
jgi:predicted transcriptional regulator of viral defense system